MADKADAVPQEGEKPFLPRWVLWLVLPAAVGPIAIFVFVLITEGAHDPTDCPFVEVGRRNLGSATVIEDGRNCVGDIEERRWTIVRDERMRTLGNRRLERIAFERDHYQWTADVTEDGEVHVTVKNEGHGEVLFREGTAEERARDGR